MTDLAYLDGHHAIIGASDAGKTWTAKYGVEQLLGQQRHTLIIDPLGVWYGLRSSADGKAAGFDIPIFGGPHGDVAIRPTDGEAIAGIVDDQRVSAIVDLSGMTNGLDQRSFVRDLVARLRRRSPGNFHFVVDEADEFVPEKVRDDVGYALQEDMLWIAKKGRSAGWVQTLITQRTADIAKSALSQSQTIIAHQLIAPQDQKPFLDYVRTQGSKEELERISANLASLQQGHRYVYSPRRHVLEYGQTPALTTFDSSRTPPAGQSRVEPRTLAQLDVSAIAAALAPRDPSIPADPAAAYQLGNAAGEALLQRDRRIAELEADKIGLGQKIEALFAERHDLLEGIRNAVAGISDALSHFTLDMSAFHDPARELKAALPAYTSVEPDRQRRDSAAVDAPPESPSGGATSPSELRALAGLAAVFPSGLTEAAWATRTGYARKGGAWIRRRKRYVDDGLIEQRDGRWFATDAGVRAAGAAVPDMPAPGIALVNWWAERLGAPGRVLRLLANVHPRALTRDAIAAELNMAPKGGAFLRHLGAVKAAELVVEVKRRLAIAPELMGNR
ncbi:hypothetical protein GGR88_001375 [Sphingomonas jejuensis]|uniref:Helicase HerA central domain-containing protein n=1 Tax=Sphingomonas jejuensis TaxID=904715 RepID=A0ABX0XMD0_9SPHN|nr:hypothetical protein [Sphingomonas jejuensis]NJC33901.1 hypothetical protein [Sphingomonas jejuensis]